MSRIKARKLYNTRKMTEEDWLLARKKLGIGGSEASSISGLNKWSSPLEVYLNKTEPDLIQKNYSEIMEWGNRLEGIIRKKFREEHPEWRIQQSFIMWQHPDHDFMIGNVDSIIFDPKRGWGVHEIKTSSEWGKDNWGENECPPEYIIQIQHYLAVLGLEWGVFSVLIGGNKYREFYIERDDVLIEALIKLEKDFWENHVLKNIPPLPDGSDSAEEMLQLLHPVSTALPEDEVLELSNETMDLIEELDEIKLKMKELEKRKNEIGQLIELQLGDYQKAVCSDRKITWKPSRSFKEDELKKAEPELYEEYAMKVLDKNKLKQDYPKKYNEYMFLRDKKTLTIK